MVEHLMRRYLTYSQLTMAKLLVAGPQRASKMSAWYETREWLNSELFLFLLLTPAEREY